MEAVVRQARLERIEDKETVMYFIERLFGVSPDGGSGSVEFLLFAVPVLGVGLLTLWRRRNYGMRR
jgi:MYXO-CTERM domain-containing protein